MLQAAAGARAATLALVLAAVAGPPASAQQALVLSHAGTFTGPDGAALDMPPFSVGAVVSVETEENGTYRLESDGTVAWTAGEGLALKASPGDGCFAVSLSQAFESPGVFDSVAILGAGVPPEDSDSGDHYGASLVLKAKLSAELAAGVSICPYMRRVTVLVPVDPGVAPPQQMAARPWTMREETRWEAGLRAEAEASFEAGAEIAMGIEAYCLDSPKRAPAEDDRYRPVTATLSDLVLAELQSEATPPPSARLDCVWAARATADPDDVAEAHIREVALSSAAQTSEFLSPTVADLLVSMPAGAALTERAGEELLAEATRSVAEDATGGFFKDLSVCEESYETVAPVPSLDADDARRIFQDAFAKALAASGGQAAVRPRK